MPQTIPYRLTTLEEVEASTNFKKPLFFDSETDGKYGTIELGQFYQEHWSEVLLVRKPQPMLLAVYLNAVEAVMHNAHYDISTIQAQTGTRWVPDSYIDTFHLSRLSIYKSESFSLDDCMAYVLGEDPYEARGLNKSALQKSDWTKRVLTEDQLLYASIDVYYLPAVYHATKDALEEYNYKLDYLATRIFLDMQNVGMPVIEHELDKLYQEKLAEIDSIHMPINANSWQQVRKYLNSTESDDLALAKMEIQGNEKAANVRKVRKARKLLSFLDKFNSDEGRIYGRFKSTARSGRSTSDEQNLQQLPRASKCVFGVEQGSGRVIVYADFAALELRCICAITGEPLMDRLFREGEDLHGYTARMLFGEDYTPKQRQIAKTCNFNLLYGGSWKMLGSILISDANILLSEEELKAIKRRWHNLWRIVTRWQEAGIKAWRRGLPGVTPLGRRYTAKLMTDQLNIENQGFGSEVAKLALHYMYPKVKELEAATGTVIELCNFVHDSYVWECDENPEVYKQPSEIIADSMQKAWVESTKGVKITDLPMPVKVAVGWNWKRLDSDEPEACYVLNRAA